MYIPDISIIFTKASPDMMAKSKQLSLQAGNAGATDTYLLFLLKTQEHAKVPQAHFSLLFSLI